MNDAVTAAYAKMLASKDTNVFIVKKIMTAVKAADAKTVTVTMRREDKEFAFKYEARSLEYDCGRKYNSWNADAAGRRELERGLGRGDNDFYPQEIVRIAYGRNTLYEVVKHG
jgi:hypothetical protein